MKSARHSTKNRSHLQCAHLRFASRQTNSQTLILTLRFAALHFLIACDFANFFNQVQIRDGHFSSMSLFEEGGG